MPAAALKSALHRGKAKMHTANPYFQTNAMPIPVRFDLLALESPSVTKLTFSLSHGRASMPGNLCWNRLNFSSSLLAIIGKTDVIAMFFSKLTHYKPRSRMIFSLLRQFSATLTKQVKYTRAASIFSMSRRAATPTRLSIAPFLPMIIPLCDAFSQ